MLGDLRTQVHSSDIEDTNLRSGADLHELGQREVEATAHLVAAVPGAADGAQSPRRCPPPPGGGWVTSVAEVQQRLLH